MRNQVFVITSLSIISFHTDLWAHWSWRPFWSLHSWESHITLKSRIATFTLQSTGTSSFKKKKEHSIKKGQGSGYTVHYFFILKYYSVFKMLYMLLYVCIYNYIYILYVHIIKITNKQMPLVFQQQTSYSHLPLGGRLASQMKSIALAAGFLQQAWLLSVTC